MNSLVEKFQEYSTWRFSLTCAVEGYRQWLRSTQLIDRDIETRIARLLAKLAEDRLTIAFIAEFSRGKSELINAIFFADYGKRILPSSAGRTTMCPTELMYDETLPPSIRLLPIETRAQHATTADYKELPDEWRVSPLDTRSGDGMLEAFKQVSMTRRVPVEEAQRYGLHDADDPEHKTLVDENGTVEISMWRHAVINFPHPLLAQGLVILDTPGLNAIGTEPELTLNLIPNAHAVLFILAADTGVTRTDIEVWRQHIGAAATGKGHGRMVVLNKIDSMWDDLTSERDVDAMIERQVHSCAKTLEIDASHIFPVSAQKGLSAKVHGDDALLAKSRLPALERAMSIDLIPRKQEIFRDIVAREMAELIDASRGVLLARASGLARQAGDLQALRGKNASVVTHMVTRVKSEKSAFDRSLMTFQALRSVFARASAELFAELGVHSLREEIRTTREQMVRSWFSTGLRGTMEGFFTSARSRLARSQSKTDEIAGMVSAMYRKFSSEHGMMLAAPMKFSLVRYQNEVVRVEGVYHDRFGLVTIFSNDQLVLTQKFFESIASRVRETFEAANRDVEAWLKAVMAPLEGQIREHQSQLRRRIESIKHIQDTSETLEERLAETSDREAEITELLQALRDVDEGLQMTLHAQIDAEQGALIF
ncbi:MAG: dynamin family protein [Burkholderiaceae bacterium]